LYELLGNPTTQLIEPPWPFTFLGSAIHKKQKIKI
jgi:hypothetical protein